MDRVWSIRIYNDECLGTMAEIIVDGVSITIDWEHDDENRNKCLYMSDSNTRFIDERKEN